MGLLLKIILLTKLTVTRDNNIDIELAKPSEGIKPMVRVRLVKPAFHSMKNAVRGEDYSFFRQIHGNPSGGMALELKQSYGVIA